MLAHIWLLLAPSNQASAYTGWPRKNATILLINFKDIVNKTDLFLILLGRKFIYQQNDTMTITFGWGIWILGQF